MELSCLACWQHGVGLDQTRPGTAQMPVSDNFRGLGDWWRWTGIHDGFWVGLSGLVWSARGGYARGNNEWMSRESVWHDNGISISRSFEAMDLK